MIIKFFNQTCLFNVSRTHLGLLQGPLLALVFPVFDTYKLPFEVIFFILLKNVENVIIYNLHILGVS